MAEGVCPCPFNRAVPVIVNDPRLELLLQSALRHLIDELGEALDGTEVRISELATPDSSSEERLALTMARGDVLRLRATLHHRLSQELRERTEADLNRDPDQSSTTAHADWSELSLVDDAEIEQTVTASRLIRQLEGGCEAELHELQAFFATLQGLPSDHETFPLRPAIVGKAMQHAIAETVKDDAVRNVIARAFTDMATPRLKACYRSLLESCRLQGVRAAPLAVRRQSGGNTTSGGSGSAGSTQSGALGPSGQTSGRMPLSPPQVSHQALVQSMAQQIAAQQALSDLFNMSVPVAAGPGHPAERPAPGSAEHQRNEQNVLGLMRRLNAAPVWAETAPAEIAPGAYAPTDISPLGAPMAAANLIRTHRDELLNAAGGSPLDQMVIDIVGALFDQVLSDPKVPPQMARQIGRLQLPVLRVALRDQTFFSSRKHPVRRLINRMASMAAGFEEVDEGPGAEGVRLVTELVGQIVEGDFDSLDVYDSKLGRLESFIADQARQEAEEQSDAARILSGREADLRVQQRYMQQVRQELTQVEAPDFLKEFLAQIWTQVQVLVAGRFGPDSAPSARMKQVAHELVLSVQPKGHPKLRQDFLRSLPPLMKDLNEGLDLIQWAQPAREAFLGQLLPLHAEALKAPPAHDLTTRLLENNLRKVVMLPIPSREAVADEPLPEHLVRQESSAMPMLDALAPSDASAAGWMPEASLLQGDLDIDLSAGNDPELDSIHIELPLDAPAPPSAGVQLVHHVRAGSAYQMVLKGQWKKVRLTWVSEGRTFFIFSHGRSKSRETISLTGRSLAKLCESGRFRAMEQAELLERATVRARRQLAALKPGAQPVTASAA